MNAPALTVALKWLAAIVLIVAFWVASELSPEFKTYGTLVGLCLLTLIAIGGAVLNAITWLTGDTEEMGSSRALRTDNTPHLPVDPRDAR
jgi:hypothetical protein